MQKFFVKATLHLEETYFWLETDKTDTCDDEFVIDHLYFAKTYEWTMSAANNMLACNPTDASCAVAAQQIHAKFSRIMEVLKTYEPVAPTLAQ